MCVTHHFVSDAMGSRSDSKPDKLMPARTHTHTHKTTQHTTTYRLVLSPSVLRSLIKTQSSIPSQREQRPRVRTGSYLQFSNFCLCLLAYDIISIVQDTSDKYFQRAEIEPSYGCQQILVMFLSSDLFSSDISFSWVV